QNTAARRVFSMGRRPLLQWDGLSAAMKVLCTETMSVAAMELLKKVADVVILKDRSASGYRSAIADADFLVVRNKLPDDIFQHAARLRGVVRHGTGLDLIPVDAATALGIPVANVPGANAQAVVEYYVSAMLAFARPLLRMEATLRSQGWEAGRALTSTATQLSGQAIGTIGVGTIGTGLAQTGIYGTAKTVL